VFSYPNKNKENPEKGKVLIANPFLKDPHFVRSVVLLCEHRDEGSFGFIFNKPFHQTLDELLDDVTFKKIPVYLGGPVQLDTLHFIHQEPGLIEGGIKIIQGVYWGGDFERAIELLNNGVLDDNRIKFFLGYAGWSDGQLENELEEKSWIVAPASLNLLFKQDNKETWQQSLRDLGKDFAILANYPIDPTLN
jgi:putative transcriptional regulator